MLHRIARTGEQYPQQEDLDFLLSPVEQGQHQKDRRNTNNTMEKPKPKMNTMRTYDSSDDLFGPETEEDVKRESASSSEELEDGEALAVKEKGSSVWDCKAIRWPPHSVPKVFKSSIGYLKAYHLSMEVVLLGLFVLLCYILPGERFFC